MEEIKNEILRFKTGQSVWLFDGEDYRRELVIGLTDGEYELSDGNLNPEGSVFKTKKECAYKEFPPVERRPIIYYKPISITTICANGSEKYGAKASTFFATSLNRNFFEVEANGKTKELAMQNLIVFLSDDGQNEIEEVING